MSGMKKGVWLHVRTLVFVGALLLLFMSGVRADIWVASEALHDANVEDMLVNSSFGNLSTIVVGMDRNITKEGLISFDLSSLDLGNESLRSATLLLHIQDGAETERTNALYRVNDVWDEETVTWNTRPETVVESTDIREVPAESGLWIAWDVADDVQAFIDGTENYGWMVRDIAGFDEDVDDEAVDYVASESDVSELRPRLVIEFGNESGFDTNDLLTLLSCWGEVSEGCEEFDINDDGSVDQIDFDSLLLVWEGESFTVVLTEPSGTYDSPNNIPLEFSLDGQGFTCSYYVLDSSGDFEIQSTAIPGCGDTQFGVAGNGDYELFLAVTGSQASAVTISSEFTVSSSSSSSDSNSGDDDDDNDGGNGDNDPPSFWIRTFLRDDEELQDMEPIRMRLESRERVRVMIDGEKHYAGLVGIISSGATFRVGSEHEQDAELIEGDVAQFEVTGDGLYDIEIEVLSMDSGEAEVEIRHTQEEVGELISLPGESDSEGEPGFLSRITGAVITPDGSVRATGWVMLLALIVAVFAFYQFYQSGRTKKQISEEKLEKDAVKSSSKKEQKA